MDVGALAERYGGVPPRVQARAREFLRRTAAVRASAAQDLAAPAACLLVAAKALGEPALDLKRLSALAGSTPRLVELSARKVIGAVDVRAVVQTTPAALCIRFGCEAIAELVTRVYAEYQVVAERLARGKGKGNGRAFDHREPVFAAACLFACSKHANLRVDKTKLLDAVCGNPKSFEAIVTSIETHCKASLSGAILARRKRAPKPPSSSAAALADAADADAAAALELRDERQESNTPRKTSTRTLRRVVEQSHDSRSFPVGADAPDDIATPTSARQKSVSDDEYAAWRAAALAHMRAKVVSAAPEVQ